jgi:hypothetical protein
MTSPSDALGAPTHLSTYARRSRPQLISTATTRLRKASSTRRQQCPLAEGHAFLPVWIAARHGAHREAGSVGPAAGLRTVSGGEDTGAARRRSLQQCCFVMLRRCASPYVHDESLPLRQSDPSDTEGPVVGGVCKRRCHNEACDGPRESHARRASPLDARPRDQPSNLISARKFAQT